MWQYGFEDRALLVFDHELSVKEFSELLKIHGFLVGYYDANDRAVYYCDDKRAFAPTIIQL